MSDMGMRESFDRTLAKAVQRADGWANALTGIGALNRDKRMAAKPSYEMIQRNELEAIWRGDDMAARIVETVPHEMMREGFEVRVQDDAQVTELLMSKLEDLDVHNVFREALEYERAYGGAAILLGADDGSTDMSQPLNEEGIKSLDWLTVMAAYELHPTMYYADPQAPGFGKPMVYQLHPDMPAISNVTKSYIAVHESRIIRFDGVKVSRRQMRQNNGWGDSVFVRVKQVLADFGQTWASAAILLQDFSQAVLKINGLADLIATNQDDVLARRAQALDMGRSVARMFIIDSEEDFERKATPMTGMPDMLQQFSLRLAAAGGMPVSLLMGQAPAGLNATGASDVRFFYDQTKAKQHNHLKPKLSRLTRLVMKTRGSPTRGVEAENWSIYFFPLWQPTSLETAQERLAIAQADNIYLMSGTLSPSEVAISRFGGDGWSSETTIDTDARSRMGAAVPPKKPSEQDKVQPTKVDPGSGAPTGTVRGVPAGGPGPQGINGGPT